MNSSIENQQGEAGGESVEFGGEALLGVVRADLRSLKAEVAPISSDQIKSIELQLLSHDKGNPASSASVDTINVETVNVDTINIVHEGRANATSPTVTMTASMTGSEALVQSLVQEGVTTLFGYPGGAIMPIYDALYGVQDQLRHVLVRHEQGATHAAEAYARVTGKVGVCMATSGPGATNLITGIADAMMDSVPMVCITGQVASPLLGTEAFQEVDIIGMTLSVTKWSYQVTNADEIPEVIAKAFRIAKEGRPGPVLIDMAKDAQVAKLRSTEPSPQRLGGASRAFIQHARGGQATQEQDARATCMAARTINEANRPLILAGHGVLLAGAEGLLRQLAEQAQIPVACTLHGMSAMPTDHPLYVGMLGMHGNYAPNLLTNSADVIIALGMRFDDRVTGRLNSYAKQAKIIHLDIDPYQVDRLVHTTHSLIGDLKETLSALLPQIETKVAPVNVAPVNFALADDLTQTGAERRSWFAEFERLRAEEQHKVISYATNPSSGPLKMSEVVHQFSLRSKGELLVVADVGQHQMMAARYYDFRHPRSFISSGGLGTMGFALPAAIGAKLGAPDRQVLAVIGDGSFQMTPQELGVIAQEQLDVKILILNNSYLGMVRQWQQLFFDRRYSFVELHNPDFVKLADAYGIAGAKIEHRADLALGIEKMLNHKGAYLLEVVVEAEQNVFPMVPAGCSVAEMRLE